MSDASGRTEPRIRGSLHFGAVIVGEIGDIKRTIVFNGDVMDTAARLEELSRGVEGGFLAPHAAMEQFRSALPVKLRDLRRIPIRGRPDGIDVVGLDHKCMKRLKSNASRGARFSHKVREPK